MSLIFDKSVASRYAYAQAPNDKNEIPVDIPSEFLRQTPPNLPAVSELQAVRHYTNLSRLNFSIDTHFYPLGSCTMKYNPRAAHDFASLPGFLSRHPFSPDSHSQGFMACVYELQETLKEVTGMQAISLSSMAGAQGEFAGIAMIKAYHQAAGDTERNEIIVPDAAHGTNPASGIMCGYKVKEVPTGPDGDIDLEKLKSLVGPNTAGIMLTNPSTCGVFERKILEIANIVHSAGGLLYYDGANLNAIMGKARPGDMGFDVMHINLHKTFATPHGGGGPGAGPVACNKRLEPFLPVPYVAKNNNEYVWCDEDSNNKTIGRLSAFAGNAGIILRAFAYARLLGREGLKRVSEFATLNANYLMKKLASAGLTLAYPERRASHEFIVTFKNEKKSYSVTAMDIAKRILDYGFHAPTTYFPLLIPECFLIEPTETEDKATLDAFVEAIISIINEARTDASLVTAAPQTCPVKRLDDVKAARDLDIVHHEYLS